MSARPHPHSMPDIVLLAVTLFLSVLGVVMVYSASFFVAQTEYDNDTYFLSKQVLWVVVALAVMVLFALVDYHRWEEVSLPVMGLALLALLLVLVPGLGVTNYGAQRWLKLGPFPPVQPSEVTKLALIIYMSCWLSGKGTRVREFSYGFIPFALLLTAVTALVMAQPDMGTSFVLAVTAACIFFVAGANLLHVSVAALGGVVGFAYLMVAAVYRQDRLQAFLNPWADPNDTGYHTIQTLIALGSGGLSGLGLGASRQKFYYVPNAHTDAIFAIIGEELGLVGVVIVILLFGVFAWRGFRIAFRAPDRFGMLLATGVTCLIVVQALTNIAVVSNAIPYTGITLPFISFGGNSLIVSMAGVGLLLGISRYGPRRRATSPRDGEVVARLRKQNRQRVAASSVSLTAPRRRQKR